MMADSEAVGAIARGHVLLAVCAVLYLAWWAIFFRPGAQVTGALYAIGALCLVGAAVCGVAGAMMAGGSIASIPPAPGLGRVPLAVYAGGAIAVYVVLAALTRGLLARPVTTELVLIVAWCALELACTAVLAQGGVLAAGTAAGLVALVAALTVGSLVCYVLYYHLGPVASFIDGAVPLAAVGLEAVVVAVLLMR